MEHRLGRTLRVFLVVLATAGFYRLSVVPWVEPNVANVSVGLELSPEQAAALRARADRRLAAVGELFPSGSWEREEPIMLESRQMRLLFKQYHTLPDGRVNLVPCTLVILPDRKRDSPAPAEGRTLVLRAPQGAVLEFDQPLDLRQGRLGKLVGGSLRGKVTIRGTPSAAGADDEIEIETRDVELEEMEIRTSEMVQFRYGRSTGSGRAMVARMLPRETPGAQGPNIGGVDTIRLDRDVRLRLEGLAGGFLPGQGGSEPAAASAPTAEAPPVLVSCRGSLCMNVAANVISFEDHVDVVRTLPGGTSDQLVCDLLAIVLGREAAAPGSGGVGGGLRPVEIQAKGMPVVAKSGHAGLEARGARLGYEIASRRILLDGEEPVSLVLQGTEMEARSIDYSPGPPGDPGSLMAVGPGWLRARSEGSPPLQARWQKWLRMRPADDGSGHVASLAGDADVLVESQGRLKAGELHLWLDIVPGTRPALPARGVGAGLSGVKPARMLARTMVEIDVEQLTARTDKMEVWFRHTDPPTPPPPVPAAGGVPPPPAQLAAAGPAPIPVAAPPVAAVPAPAVPSPEPVKPADPSLPTRGRLVATGALMRGLVSMSPQGNQLDELSLEGQVHLVEEPLPPGSGGLAQADGQPPPAEAALEIKGDQLQLSRATRFDALAIVSGRPAQVSGRGIDLQGPLIEFDRGRNRLTVDGAGRLKIPLAGGMGGLDALGMGGAQPQAPARTPAPGTPAGELDVSWQGRMYFDGLTARFLDRVVTTSGQSVLRAGTLDVVFNRPIDFGAQATQRGGQRADVARVICGNGVRIESETASADGGRSMERLFVRDLVIDRATGDVSGSGPGRLATTRFGQPPGMGLSPGLQAPGPGAAPQPAAQAPARADELTYLGVDFQRSMRGNLNRRVMEFQQRVEAIYGPVAGWGETLDPHAPGGLAARCVSITSDSLSVGQTPLAPGQQRSTMELAAGGNVMVEGDAFTARSTRLSWSEAKDLLVFEGDGRSDAQLFRQERVGAPTSSASAGKILYWRALNRIDVDDARHLDFDQLGGAGMRLPGMGAAPPAAARPAPGS